MKRMLDQPAYQLAAASFGRIVVVSTNKPCGIHTKGCQLLFASWFGVGRSLQMSTTLEKNEHKQIQGDDE